MKIQEFLKDKCIRLYCHLKFLRVSIFILVLIGIQAALESSIATILITHLTGDGLQLPYAASVVNVQDGVSSLLLLLVACASDTLLGSFGTVVVTNFSYFTGLLLLYFSALKEKEDVSSLFVAAIFIALGRSGRDISLKKFLEDQCKAEWQVDRDEFKVHQDKECWRIASVLGVIVSIWVSWIYKDIEWVELSKISVIGMGLGFAFFLAGIPFYHVIKLPQATMENKHFSPTSSSSTSINSGHISMETELRWVVSKEVKKMLSMIPLWTAFLVYGLVQATANVFFYQQFNYMDPNIGLLSNVPVVIFAVITKFSSFGVSYICAKRLKSHWKEKVPRHVVLIRIGIGLAVAPVCCVIAWRVESYRLDLKHFDVSPPSAAWLIPQFLLLGILDGLISDGIEEFFVSRVSVFLEKYGRSLAQFAPNMGHFISLALVLNLRSFFGDSLETSKLGLYYAMLGYVCFVNFVYYSFVATYFVKKQGET